MTNAITNSKEHFTTAEISASFSPDQLAILIQSTTQQPEKPPIPASGTLMLSDKHRLLGLRNWYTFKNAVKNMLTDLNLWETGIHFY
jgi:hypothetical protein